MSEVYFSVIIPVYNRAHAILKAVESIYAQEFTNWELIIINDASTDNTAGVLSTISDSRVRIFHNPVNKERCETRNIGISLAKGKYICFLDSDDYHLPTHLSSFYQLINANAQPEAFFFSNAWNEDEAGNRTPRECPDFDKYNPYTYFLTYTVNPQRWCVAKSIFEKVQFDPEVVICEDMDTSMRIVNAGYRIFQVKERTTVYVAAADSFTHGDTNKAEKELFYLKRIFSKPELQGKLPVWPKRRLLSMCYYHLAVKMERIKNTGKMYSYIFTSFILYPPGYNGKTNLPMFVMALYNLPVLGKVIQACIKLVKRI
jgi:glycosyltransferase involved in cell wall biosynthesis